MAHASSDDAHPSDATDSSSLPVLPGLRREATSSTAQREPGSALTPRSAPAPTSPEQTLCAAYEHGQSVTTIARARGASDVEIRKILIQHGVTIRARGGGHDNARAIADMRVAKSLRPKHASAPQFSAAWFRQCDRAFSKAVLAAHPERAHPTRAHPTRAHPTRAHPTRAHPTRGGG